MKKIMFIEIDNKDSQQYVDSIFNFLKNNKIKYKIFKPKNFNGEISNLGEFIEIEYSRMTDKQLYQLKKLTRKFGI